MGKAGGNAGTKEPRITLRNYLDMSKSLNVEPGCASSSLSGRQIERRKWDMTKSLNAESGFFNNGSSKALPSRTTAKDNYNKRLIDLGGKSNLNSVAVAANSPVQEQESVASKGLVRSKAAGNATALKSPLSSEAPRNSLHGGAGGLNSRMLPTSPNVSDSAQEKELIEAFVDQLRNIAASSSNSEPRATTRRVVRKALEFSSHLNAAQRAGAVDPSNPPKSRVTAAAVVASATMDMEDAARKLFYRSKLKNGEMVVDRRHHRHLLPVVEEKQTVISSPITHTASCISKMKLKSADMAPAVQEHAVECAFQLLKTMDKLNCKLVAWQLKKEFDKVYGPAWHCIVGTSFGSYVTHSVGGFIYFAVGKVSILLFRTAIEVVDRK